MKRKALFILLALSLLFAVSPAFGDAALDVLSWNWYKTGSGLYQAVGELKNTGDSNASFIKCIVTLYSDAGDILASEFTYAMLDIVQPGEVTPFKVTFLEEGIDPEKAKLQWTLSRTSEAPAYQTEITQSKGYLEDNIFKVVGEVKNHAPESVDVKIVATFYNAKKEVLNADFTYPTIYPVSPESTSPFKLFILERANSIESYRLVAYN